MAEWILVTLASIGALDLAYNLYLWVKQRHKARINWHKLDLEIEWQKIKKI